MKKKLSALVLAVVLALALAACVQEPEPQYILTEFETTMHYSNTVQKTVFHFDENWVQTGATVYLDGEVTQEIIFELDDQGALKAITCTTTEGTIAEEYVNTYDDDGNLIRQEIYQDGELTTTVENTYAAGGIRIAQTVTGVKSIYEYTYNPDGTTASVKVTIADAGASLTEYTYDENGNEIRSVTTNEAGVVISETNSSYNDQGQITVSVDTYYNDDGTPRETSASEYTWEGNIRTTHISGDPENYSVIEYDEAGNMIRSEIYSGGELMTSQTMVYVKVELPAE